MSFLVHRARVLDCNGSSDDSWVRAHDGVITAAGVGDGWRAGLRSDTTPEDLEIVDAAGHWLVPGFIDLHVHGGGGHSFEDGPESMAVALETHRRHGTTRSVISLVSSPIGTLTSRLVEVAELCAADPAVLGAHLEGPYISSSRRGAHDASALRTPDLEEVETLLEAAAGHLSQVTLAPELPGADRVIPRLVEAGVVVAVGHTDCDYAQARAAFDGGASLLTHAFNAMRGIHHRDPGPVAAAFDDARVTLEVVADGQHVADPVIRLASGAAPRRIALVTDAMAATGASDGDYRLGSRDVSVRGGVPTLAGTDILAGSTLTLDAALRRALSAGVARADAIAALTSTPARALGLDHRFGQLRPGYAADLVLLDETWTVQRVITSASVS
jgi:N-acetylglucosamine-6-phosphate deacetylase